MSVSPRIAALATALPAIDATAGQVWDALGQVRGRPLPRLSSSDGVRRRRLAEPLSSLVTPRGQSEQTDAYLRHARMLSRTVCCDALERCGVPRARIGLIIGVSCTGVVLPSLDAELIPILGLDADVARLPITELGCGAGVSGLARARDFLLAYPDRAVLLFAVELPSLTFQPQDRSIDNLTAALVFGDGAGAMVLDGAATSRGWMVEGCATRLVPDAAGDLGFELRDGGLRVVLRRELPRAVEAHLRPAVEAFLAGAHLTLDDIDALAVHPGGPRIFDAVEQALSGRRFGLDLSRRVFDQVGNASSAGIFFVLEALAVSGVQGRILALSFGPGLSIELALLRVAN
jgi:alkylresorcinol/alkylpyrone synthase